MTLSNSLRPESGKATGDVGQTFRDMNDLFKLELSVALRQAVEAGLLVPEKADDRTWTFPNIKICPEHSMALLPVCEGCQPDAELDVSRMLYPVRWQVGDVFIERTPHGFCVVSQTGAVWNAAGGWDSPPQPSNRGGDWYREHNFSNLDAAMDAATAAKEK